ncbi:tRNA(m(1)G37)methyltransferase [Knufia obscura]|uniref:tRNA (guanine(37)-N1)-methyltransferase n=2 Tax=Knufia TaxID=430999 RepID=A0AAN8I152_9EURO|nr:tRNA(m(1)G37)methyltransferase [Knufia obscura]KAK5948077.1 tRNA(m(1)G37)methyltransferase [Knufia fluminis]
MSSITTAEIARPPINRDMKVLDRSFFKQKVETSALTVFSPKDISRVRAQVASSGDLLSTTTIKPVVEDETTPGAKCILLKPHIRASDPSTWKERWSDILQDGTAKIQPYELTLDYNHWDMRDILEAILPETTDDDYPSGFAQVGHVAHLNLREQFLPYKHLIGQVLIDKNVGVKTVINKLNDVGTESVFRTFPYEVLAGPDDLNVTVHHAECEFKFNYAEVYWNTRNGHEHERLTSMFQPGEAVCDVMAGVGPFAVPTGKKRTFVWANDLNPAGHKGLHQAIQANKVSDFVRPSMVDGAEFIRMAPQLLLEQQRTVEIVPKFVQGRKMTKDDRTKAQEHLQANAQKIIEPPTFDHFIMNLPASAIEFLPAFKGIYYGHEKLFSAGGRKLPIVHVYTFQARRDTEDEERSELRQRLSHHLGYELSMDRDEVNLHRARLVAPSKLYYCASFRLPAAVAFAKSEGNVKG